MAWYKNGYHKWGNIRPAKGLRWTWSRTASPLAKKPWGLNAQCLGILESQACGP